MPINPAAPVTRIFTGRSSSCVVELSASFLASCQCARENVDRAIGRMAVPQMRTSALLAIASKHALRSGRDRVGIAACQHVGAIGDGDRPLGVLAHRDAWDA